MSTTRQCWTRTCSMELSTKHHWFRNRWLLSNTVETMAGKSTEVLQPAEPTDEKTPDALKPSPNLKKPGDEINDKPALVLPSEVTPKDVLCHWGNAGINNPANLIFCQLISSNKEHFDNLSTREKETFASKLRAKLHEGDSGFLKQTNNNWYEVLNYEGLS